MCPKICLHIFLQCCTKYLFFPAAYYLSTLFVFGIVIILQFYFCIRTASLGKVFVFIDYIIGERAIAHENLLAAKYLLSVAFD